jgi:hypothetical protein
MIEFQPETFDAATWHGLSGAAPALSLLQTWEYGEAKAETSAWTVERGRLVEDEHSLGIAQVLVRALPLRLGGLAWINRGPLAIGDGAEERFPELAGALVDHYAKRRGYYLRMAPPLANNVDPAALAKVGLAPAGALGWASARLDLTRPLDQVRAGHNAKWRNPLNRAEAGGLRIEAGSDPAQFDAFLAAHDALVERKGFEATVTGGFLRALQGLLPIERKMTAINAFDGDSHVGSVLLAYYGTTAEYLAGNTSAEGRKCGAGQLMLWRALEVCKARGIARFDLGGQDPIRTPKGIMTFKRGLNGVPYRLMSDLSASGSGLLNRLIAWRVGRKLA